MAAGEGAAADGEDDNVIVDEGVACVVEASKADADCDEYDGAGYDWASSSFYSVQRGCEAKVERAGYHRQMGLRQQWCRCRKFRKQLHYSQHSFSS